MGASTVVIYGVWLLYSPVQEDFIEDPQNPGLPKVANRLLSKRCLFHLFCGAHHQQKKQNKYLEQGLLVLYDNVWCPPPTRVVK